jgi:hypothetical protein
LRPLQSADPPSGEPSHNVSNSLQFQKFWLGTGRSFRYVKRTNKGKGKVVPVLNLAPRHEEVLGSGGIAPCILDLGIRWRWVVNFTGRPPLYPQGESPPLPLG